MDALDIFKQKLEYRKHLIAELEIIKARVSEADESRNKVVYDWVSKMHPSWLKNSVIKENLDNNDDPNYCENISGHINKEKDYITISILKRDNKATKLANQGFEIEDLVWESHNVNLEKFK